MPPTDISAERSTVYIWRFRILYFLQRHPQQYSTILGTHVSSIWAVSETFHQRHRIRSDERLEGIRSCAWSLTVDNAMDVLCFAVSIATTIHPETLPRITLTPYSLLSYWSGSKAGRPNGYRLMVAALIHAAAVLIPTIRITLPRPSNGDMGLDIFMAVLNFISIIVMPLCLVLQFCAQLGELQAPKSDTDAFSMLSWCLQIPVLAALAFRWACRTGLPPRSPSGPYETLILWLWDNIFYYYTSSTVAINFAVWALEMYLLAACYLWNNWNGIRIGRI
jgi:hypothetical protein